MTTRWMFRLGVALLGLTLTFPLMLGCATTAFRGDSKVEGGPRGCYRKCQDERMEMESFVYMGEYSTACVCRLRQRPAGGEAATTSSAVGVVMQMRAQQEQQRTR